MPAAPTVAVESSKISMVTPVVEAVTPAVAQGVVFFAALFFVLAGQMEFRRYLAAFFGTHEGKLRFIRIVNDIEHKPIQGGSTLEQQYVKNVLVLQDLDDQAAQQADTADNLNRKLDQLRMAVQVAHTMTKQQILAGYLNDSYYGNGDCYVVQRRVHTAHGWRRQPVQVCG